MREKITAIINREFRRLQGWAIAVFVLAFIVLTAALYFINTPILGIPYSQWIPGFAATAFLFFIVTIIIVTLFGSAKG